MTDIREPRQSADDLIYRFRRERPTRGIGKVALGLLLTATLTLWALSSWGSGEKKSNETTDGSVIASVSGALTHTATRSRLQITVVAAGNLESSKNLEIKCQVAGGSSILWIVPDGKEVEKDEIIVKLDQSSIDDLLNSQRINLEKAQASKIQAEEDHGAAILSVQEYAEGTFLKEQQVAEANINIAQENLRSSMNLLEHTRKMSRKGFVTALQVEADEFSVERSKLELESAKISKKVLQEFTRAKTLKDLEAKRDAAAAKVRAEQAGYKLEKDRLERLERQIRNCEIKAPQNGMVIYANDQGSGRGGGSSSVKIEEGAMVRESQTILRLPDLGNMQVKMTVHESKIEQLKVGMPANIRITDREFQGKIVSIANQPEPGSWFQSNIKEYATIVKITGEAEGLKPGLTAETEVLVADLPNVIAIPVSCVVEQSGKYFAWVVTDAANNKIEKRTLLVGMTNQKLIEISDGIKEGDVVLLNPRAVVEDARKEEPKSAATETDSGKKFGSTSAKPESGAAKSQAGGEDKKPADAKDGKGQPVEGQGGGTPKAAGGGFKLPTVADIMKQDTDKDGKISKEEADDRMKQGWDRNDTNGDGFVDRTEVKEMVDRFVKFMKQRQEQGGGGPPGAQ